MTQRQIIKRLEALENQVKDVRSQLAGRKHSGTSKSFRDFVGMFQGDDDFRKAMKHGAAYRSSLRPKPRGWGTRKK